MWPLHPPSLGSTGTTAAPRGREHPGQPPPQPPAHGSGDSRSCPAITVPSSPAGREQGRREESGILAGLSLGRSQPGRRVPAQSQIRPAGARPLPPTAGAQTPARGPAGRQDSSQGQGLGTVAAQRTAVPTCAAGRKHACPHASHPPGTQATAVTTGSFYSLHLYIHGIKPSSSTCLHQASVGAAQPGWPMMVATRHTGHQGSRGVPGVPPPGDGPTRTLASLGAAGARGHPRDPQGVWRVKASGMDPSIRGTGSEPPPQHGAGGSWSVEGPRETRGAGAALGPL